MQCSGWKTQECQWVTYWRTDGLTGLGTSDAFRKGSKWCQGSQIDTSWASTLRNSWLPAALSRCRWRGPASTSTLSPSTSSTTLTWTSLLNCSLAEICLPATVCSNSTWSKSCNMTGFKRQLIISKSCLLPSGSQDECVNSVPIGGCSSSSCSRKKRQCQRFHDFLCS